MLLLLGTRSLSLVFNLPPFSLQFVDVEIVYCTDFFAPQEWGRIASGGDEILCLAKNGRISLWHKTRCLVHNPYQKVRNPTTMATRRDDSSDRVQHISAQTKSEKLRQPTAADLGAALSRGVFQKCSRILDLRVSFDWEYRR